MMMFLRRCYWEAFLIEDWYFIATDECMVIPAYWNGVVWETRTAILDDRQVRRVMAPLPKGNPNLFCPKFNDERPRQYAPIWFDVFFRKWVMVENVKVIK